VTKTASWRAGAIAVAAVTALCAAIATPASAADDDSIIQVLGINDFHGRLLPDATSGGAGGASLVTAIDALEAEYPNTVFAAAGDLIGASTFESFIAQDKPTIDVLNEAGLDVSSVGNHEFDKGYADLVDRVMAPYDSTTNPYGGAAWQYLGANVRLGADPALPETWTETFGDVTVGFIGVVTDETPSLVTPAGIEGLTFEKEYVATNREAAELKEAGADIVIALIHEGAPTTAYADAVNPANDFGEFVTNLSPDVDAVISGHTHLAYDHSVPVPEWAGRAVTERPVVSAGQYGAFLNQLLFTVDADGTVTGVETTLIDLDESVDGSLVYPSDPEAQAIIDAAKAEADVLGAQVLGTIDGPLYRARLEGDVPGSNRGGESTLGNAVAEIQRWATGADVAFMNPGGLREDLLGLAGGTGTYPSDVTYKQAALVQPFANTLVTMNLTGAQIKTVLEQQWQPAGASRPFLRLGVSNGFTYIYDPETQKVLDIRLNGASISDTTVVKVVVNSFLSTGGDNFTGFLAGTNVADSGRIDLQAQVDYLAENGTLEVPTEQRAVGVTGLDAADFTVGKTVTLGLTSLMMSGATDPVDTKVSVKLENKKLGDFSVTNVLPTTPFDEAGTASVTFKVPKVKAGDYDLVITGKTTGTVVTIPVTVKDEVLPQCKVDYKVKKDHKHWHAGHWHEGKWHKGHWHHGPKHHHKGHKHMHGDTFTATVTVKNLGAKLKGWTLEWDFAGKEKVKKATAGVKLVQSGKSVTVTSKATLNAGKSTKFDLTGTGKPGKVTEFELNGVACQVGK